MRFFSDLPSGNSYTTSPVSTGMQTQTGDQLATAGKYPGRGEIDLIMGGVGLNVPP